MFCVIPLALATAASYLGAWWWGLGLLVHFRPQLAAASLIAGLLALLLRQPLAAAVALALLIANAAPLAPYLHLDGGGAPAGAANLRVLALNMHGGATDRGKFRRLIQAEHPDLMVLTEMPGDIDGMVADAEVALPYRLIERRHLPVGIALLSRWPLTRPRIERGAGDLPVIAADICEAPAWRGCLRVVALHAARPYVEAGRAQREQLAFAAGIARAAPESRAILVGDLNLTPWAPEFATLLTRAGLQDGGAARGLTATWLSPLPFIGLFLDQVLVSPGIAVRANALGSDVGSDHFPVIADLAVPATGK